MLAPKLTRREILKAMKERRVYATQDKDLKIFFTVNGEAMGSRIDALSSGEEATISVRIDDADDANRSYRISLYYDEGPKGFIAEVVELRDVNNKESLTLKHRPKGGAGYYFLEVVSIKGGNKGMKAWTAPVWLE